MATSSEDAYGGVGAGGKFRKKPFRRAQLPTTPYDRPLTARISNSYNGSSKNPGLFAKLVVDPASKLLSYGARSFFSSVFRKRLPPPPPQAQEVNCPLSDELQVAVSDCGGGTSSLPLCSSADDGISELEQLLKQKTFSRSEIDHLTGLLQSRAAVESPSVGPKRSEGGAPDLERHQPFASSLSEECMQDEDRSLRVMSSPIINSRVIEDDMAPPAELAKAYMGRRPSKISPSNLGTRNQVHREDAGLLSNVPFASKSPNMSLNMTTSVGHGDPKNGFITPKSRGRSAIYNMARTPYSRVHPISIKKEIGSTNNFYSGLSIPASSSSLVEQNEKIEAKSMTLKRRSSVLDDDPGSVGPMRRLRQKPYLLASKIPVIAHGVESGSDLALVSSKQKLPLVVEQKNRVSKIAGQHEDDSIPSASYACVSSKSTEVASRILQHLEKLTPKEKSSESKLATVREKSTFRLTPSMLRGQALRSMEDVDSSKLLLVVQDDQKLEDRSDVALSHDRDSTFERTGKVENGDKETVIVSAMLNPAVKNEFLESSSIPGPSITADSAVKNSVAERPQTKRAFRMSVQEDFLELDDDEHSYGLATRPLAEGRGPPNAHTLGNKRSDNEEHEHLKTTSQPEAKLPVVLSKTTESSNPRAPMIETGNDGISLSFSERENVAIQSDVLSQSVSFEKANETTDSVPWFRLGSQAVDNTPPLPSVSVNVKPESKSENSISLLDAVSTADGSKRETPESDQGVSLDPLKTRDANGKAHTVPFVSNGPLISRAPAVSFTTTSHDANQISTAISGPLTSSTSVASFSWIGTSTNPTSSTSIASFGFTGFGNSNTSTSNDSSFRSNAAVSVFNFGASVDPSSALLAPSTTTISEVSELKNKAEKEPNTGSSSAIHSAVTPFVATNSGSGPSNSSANNFQGFLPATANKSSVSDFGLVSQSTSIPISASGSLPSLNMSGSMSLTTSLSHPQFNQNQSLGFSTSASSSETSMVKSGSGPTSSVGKFGASSTLSGDSVVSLNAPATPGIFGFGLGLSSSTDPVSAVGSTNGVTPPVVSYGGNSVATSVTNNASSSSIGTSGIFNFGASSSASTPAALNIFGSTWESPKTLAFSSTFTTSSPSSVFSFGTLASTTAPANATSTVFSSQSGPSSSPNFPFSTSSPAFSLPSVSLNQPIFGNRPPSFTVSPSSGDQMNAEDSMAEDPVQSSAPSIPIFGQPTISPSPAGFMFGSAAPPLSNPFQFSGQQNQIAPLNPSPFQASGSLEFNNGGSFSLGSGGADKSNRKFVKVNRNKNRKK
ncbi:nuclear pore complex protein NUP1 isoform X2 [Primulina huaijiensis]|uniref:nuclear pore complex protein NUP1 isoform X2 n=1 Tax=Primulina huaijiensis TaxID=1492673 RepID=UPI003CC7427D